MSLRLVIFDVDGTLVDSQGDILAAMTRAFGAADLAVPSRNDVLSIVGLSLPEAMAQLAPDSSGQVIDALTESYKDAYADIRATGGVAASPLYPGIPALLGRLGAMDDVLLGIATGKSRRGLTALLSSHDMTNRFVTTQVADDHPSKPHPSMILTALAETGTDAEQAVMIGDTTYDMEMARYAGVASIGVSWGYHPVDRLTSHAGQIVDTAEALESSIHAVLGIQA